MIDILIIFKIFLIISTTVTLFNEGLFANILFLVTENLLNISYTVHWILYFRVEFSIVVVDIFFLIKISNLA